MKRLFPIFAASLVLSLYFFAAFEAAAQGKFRSLAGAFEVDNSFETSGFSGLSGGVQFKWRVEDAEISIGHLDVRAVAKAIHNEEFSAEGLLENYYRQFSQRGERVLSLPLQVDNAPGHQIRYKTKDVLFIARVLPAGDKVYVLTASVPLSKSEKLVPKIEGFFDSFRLITDETVAKEVQELVARSTPKAFAPSSRSAKAVSDISDQGLKGKPRSILLESARYGSDQVLLRKKNLKLEEFDDSGFLLKEVEYNSDGMPNKIYVYGFLDGKRVARISNTLSEGNLVGMAFPMSGKLDDRFQEYYVYRYGAGRLVESRNYWSNQTLYSRTT